MADAKINPDKGSSEGTVVRNGLSTTTRLNQPARKIEEPEAKPEVETVKVVEAPKPTPVARPKPQPRPAPANPKPPEQPVVEKPEAPKSDDAAAV